MTGELGREWFDALSSSDEEAAAAFAEHKSNKQSSVTG